MLIWLCGLVVGTWLGHHVQVSHFDAVDRIQDDT